MDKKKQRNWYEDYFYYEGHGFTYWIEIDFNIIRQSSIFILLYVLLLWPISVKYGFDIDYCSWLFWDAY